MRAYIYLNIDFPITALAATRGVLVSARTAKSESGWQSMLAASLMLHNRESRLLNELILEGARALTSPASPSRLAGLFCFEDRSAAVAAAGLWGGPFRTEYLTEVEIHSDATTVRVDSNWYTFAPRDSDGVFPHSEANDVLWMARYWRGEPCPSYEPVWETIVEGRLTILSHALRQRAADLVAQRWPESLWLVEIWRAAAAQGSDLGEIAALLRNVDDVVSLVWLVNMKDADNEELIGRLEIISSHLRPEGEAIGKIPDLREYGFERPIRNMPFLEKYGRSA